MFKVVLIWMLFIPIDLSADINLALNRPASQSSSYSESAAIYPARLAVDGNNNTDLSRGSCSVVGDGPGGPNWLVVDLGQQYYIRYAVLTNRNHVSLFNRLDYFIVGVTNEFSSTSRPVRGTYPLCGQYPTVAINGGRMLLNCNGNTPAGQFVIIQQPQDGLGGLTICELEVYGYAKFEDQFIGYYQNISSVYVALNRTTLTIQWCISQCQEHGSTFVAISDGVTCFCCDDVRNSASDEGCTSTCAGNVNQCCGAQHSYVVYSVCPIGFYGPGCEDRCHCKNGSPCNNQDGTCFNGCDESWSGSACNLNTSANSSSVSFEYIGCFRDSPDRDIDGVNIMDYTDLSTAKCLTFCLNNKYLYFGTQYAWYCCCGLTYGKLGSTNDSECNMACSGRASETCGAGYRNSVYSVLCPNGTYGANCSKVCHCSNHSRCYIDGRCMSGGCEKGWTGVTCNVRNCTEHNGACAENEVCKHIDLTFTSVARCECEDGYRRIEYWDPCTSIPMNKSTPTTTDKSNQTLTSPSSTCTCTYEHGLVAIIPLAVLLGVFVLSTLSMAIYIKVKLRDKSSTTLSLPTKSTTSNTGNESVKTNDENLYELTEENYEDSKKDVYYEGISSDSREYNQYTSLSNRRTIMAP